MQRMKKAITLALCAIALSFFTALTPHIAQAAASVNDDPPNLSSSTMIPGPIYLNALSAPGGKYNVTILWFSSDIGKNNTFSITLKDAATGKDVYEGLAFGFSIMQQERVIMTERVTGPAQPDTGTTRYAYGTSYAFESPGGYLLKIADINGSAESVEIPIQVTPEYHSVMIGLSVLAAAVAATVIVTSSATLKRNWFSQ